MSNDGETPPVNPLLLLSRAEKTTLRDLLLKVENWHATSHTMVRELNEQNALLSAAQNTADTIGEQINQRVALDKNYWDGLSAHVDHLDALEDLRMQIRQFMETIDNRSVDSAMLRTIRQQDSIGADKLWIAMYQFVEGPLHLDDFRRSLNQLQADMNDLHTQYQIMQYNSHFGDDSALERSNEICGHLGADIKKDIMYLGDTLSIHARDVTKLVGTATYHADLLSGGVAR